jgi:hypothetical protein
MRFEKPAADGARALRFDWQIPLLLAEHGGLFAFRQTGASLKFFGTHGGATTWRAG